MKQREQSGSVRPLAKTALILLLLFVAARTVGVVNSFVATDIAYENTAWPTVLYYLKLVFAVAAFGVGVGAMVLIPRKRWHLWLVFAGISFADGVAAFLIDALSGTVTKDLLAPAALSCFGNWLLAGGLMALAACIIQKRSSRPGTLFVSSLVYMGGRLLMETLYLVQFLVEVEFAPYPREILSILSEYGEILLLYGGVAYLAAFVTHRLFAKKAG